MKKDVRKFIFRKWILPKTTAMLSKNDDISFGYYDFFRAEKVKVTENENPLEMVSNKKEDTALDRTCQEILVFTNIADKDTVHAYQEEQLESFWNDTKGVIYISLLHLKDNVNLETIFKSIKFQSKVKAMEKHEKNNSEFYSSICYFTFDYSDIIICTKNLSLTKLAKWMFDLNRDKENGIRDSFSIFNISRDIVKTIFDIFDQIKVDPKITYKEIEKRFLEKKFNDVITLKEYFFNDRFSASFNLGIQDYTVLNNLQEDLGNKVKLYKLLGRQDVTFYNENANIFWLLYAQYCVEKYSTVSKQSGRSVDDVILTCETFIRIGHNDDKSNNDVNNKSKESSDKESKNVPDYYNAAKGILSEKITKFLNKIEKNDILYNLYKKPLITMEESTLGLLKNGFANDFVICYFESFCNFLDYIKERHTKDLSKCFNEYFDNFNALVHSTMHNERQFIQSPSFNAVFYDVPPKLMGYYTALTHSIVNIAKSGNKIIYSFVLRPGFWRDTGIKQYSLTEEPPTDRLLSVYVNEETLYHPTHFIKILCHEIAHYVDNGYNRKRGVRKSCWLGCMLYTILVEYITTVLKKKVPRDERLALCIEHLLELAFQDRIIKKDNEYSSNFKIIILKTINIIQENAEAAKILKIFFSENNLNPMDNPLDVFEVNASVTRFIDYLEYVKNYLLYENINFPGKLRNVILEKYNVLDSVFYEAYADLQMILMLKISLLDYLSTFIIYEKERSDLRNWKENSYYRIFIIVYFFFKISRHNWDIRKAEKETDNDKIKELIKYLKVDMSHAYTNLHGNKKLFTITEEERRSVTIDDNDKLNNYWITSMCEYLYAVYNESDKHYTLKEKSKDLKILRKNYKCISKFDDIIRVVSNVKKINMEYSKVLYNIDSNHKI